MNRKLKKIRNRLVETIQANYSIGHSDQKSRSTMSNPKYRTLVSQKIQSGNNSTIKSKSKRVYLTNINDEIPIVLQQPNAQSKQEENLSTLLQGSDHRYAMRVKSSNTNMNVRSKDKTFSNEKSMRMTSKISRAMNDINVQFESELYWNGNSSYLVTGVKNQYEKIKRSYEDKCIEVQKIKREYKVDALKQAKVYINKLEIQNSKLIEAIEKYRDKLSKYREARSSASELMLQKLPTRSVSPSVDEDSQKLISKLQLKIENLNKKNSTLSKQNKKLLSKVYMQERIIIQKENNQFKISQKAKRVQKQLSEMKQALKNCEQKLKNQQKNHEGNIQQLKLILKQENTVQRFRLSCQLRQKDLKIDKLEKQLSHVKSLLQSWKNHQAEKQLMHSNRQSEERQQGSQCNDNNDMHNFYNSKITISPQNEIIVTKEKSKIKFKNSIQNQLSHHSNHPVNNLSQRSINKSGFRHKMAQSKFSQKETQKTIKRERITAKTYKQSSVRCRPVQINEIQPTIDYLKLKLAYKRIDPDDIKKYFQYSSENVQHQPITSLAILGKPENLDTRKEIQPSRSQISNKNEVKQDEHKVEQNNFVWQHEYITLNEVYQVFIKEPFSIRDNQALLLSRFIIQDVKQPYVYMNWDSENSRRMVQSIVSNLLSFSTLKDTTVQKSQQLLTKFQSVLVPALKPLSTKSGNISREKFIQILNGLGLQRTIYMDEYIIGKMCCYSHSLQQLNFPSLFQQKKCLDLY